MARLSPEKYRRFVRHPLNIIGSLVAGVGFLMAIANPLGWYTIMGISVLVLGIRLAYIAHARVERSPD